MRVPSEATLERMAFVEEGVINPGSFATAWEAVMLTNDVTAEVTWVVCLRVETPHGGQVYTFDLDHVEKAIVQAQAALAAARAGLIVPPPVPVKGRAARKAPAKRLAPPEGEAMIDEHACPDQSEASL